MTKQTKSDLHGDADRSSPVDEKVAKDFLSDAYALQTRSDMEAFYDRWAERYDEQMDAGLGYLSARGVANLLDSGSANDTTRVLDIGCGTGMAGAHLAELGYSLLDGLDLSPSMLQIARKRDIYSHLIAADLLKPLALGDTCYDAAVCCGTFTHGHVDATPLDEIFRLLKPNGLFAFTVHFDLWESAGFSAKLKQLTDLSQILCESREAGQYFSSGEKEGWFCLYRKTV